MQAKNTLLQRTFCAVLLAAVIGAAVLATAIIARAEGPAPIKPLGLDGHPLNTDFETGTLQDWTATGDAFKRQPIHGDTVAKRQPGLKSGHQGEYWVGTYEIGGDIPQGTLTSAPFKVMHPFASFLVAGGPGPKTRVELVEAGTGNVIFKISGDSDQELRPVIVHLASHMGATIFIRIVDEDSGGWGYISFDDFEFYDDYPNLVNALDSEQLGRGNQALVTDHTQYTGLTPEDQASAMTLPPGFKATLFAGEPDVKQPIAFCFDDRGRIWVAENYTYPIRSPEGQGKDRILVFEDTKGNGKFDKRTVFMEGLNLVSGLEVGFGGVWVGAAPYLMYIPMKDGDEPKPAGKPQILLDGFSYEDTHDVLSTFHWGPDGWLYGGEGILDSSNVGKPGAPASERTPLNAAVWRFHPIKHTFEIFGTGTSNPWGIDFDEHGQCMIESCVVPHLYHIVQGGHFTRVWYLAPNFNPYVYEDIPTIADHLHYYNDPGTPTVTAGANPWASNERSGALGGGHAHAGLMLYQGDNWPKEYVGRFFMNNLHGRCINMDVPERQGSGFVAHHAPNMIDFNDSMSLILNLEAGPDGSVYMIDWYDRNHCHNVDPNATDRSNGRIFKVTYIDPAAPKVKIPKDLARESDRQLLKYQVQYGNGPAQDNWLARHARRILQERAVAGKLKIDMPKELAKLRKSKFCGEDQDLHLLWTEQITTGLSDDAVQSDLKSPEEYIRAWTIQFLCENQTVSPAMLQQFVHLATTDKSPVVRLYLAAALQRLPLEDRWDLVKRLSMRTEDVKDHNIPLMVWYAFEPMAAKDPERAITIAESSGFTNLLNFTVRRAAALGTPQAFAVIDQSLMRVDNDQSRLDILRGLSFTLTGQRNVRAPQDWYKVKSRLASNPNDEIHNLVQSLSLTFGSVSAQADYYQTLADESSSLIARRAALDALLGAKDKGLAPVMQNLLGNPDLRETALRGLAAYDDASTPEKILALYSSYNLQEKRDALNTLAARVSFAKALLSAIADGTVPRIDVTADIVRNLRNLNDAGLNNEMAKYWTVMRESSAEKKAQIEKIKKMYQAGGIVPGMDMAGRGVFSRTCQQCHTLFGVGGKVGPDLTGSNRSDLDYLLGKILDPSAIIPNDTRAWILEMNDDRTITGIIRRQDDNTITIVTPNETLILPRNEIRSLKQSQISMMPEGLLSNLKDREIRELIYYLSQTHQVPMPQASQDPPAKPLPVNTPEKPAETIPQHHKPRKSLGTADLPPPPPGLSPADDLLAPLPALPGK